MKNLLSILGAFAMTGTTGSLVIACGSKATTSAAQEIINKIKNTSMALPGNVPSSSSNKDTIIAMKTLLKTNNSFLTNEDLLKLSFIGSFSIDSVKNNPKKITVRAQVGNSTAHKGLTVFKNPLGNADIKNAISTTAEYLIQQQSAATTITPDNNPAFKKALIEELLAVNTSLTLSESSEIGMVVGHANFTLNETSANPLVLTIGSGVGQVTTNIKVLYASTGNDIANNIKSTVAIPNATTKRLTAVAAKSAIKDKLLSGDFNKTTIKDRTTLKYIGTSNDATPGLRYTYQASIKSFKDKVVTKSIGVVWDVTGANFSSYIPADKKAVSVKFDSDKDVTNEVTQQSIIGQIISINKEHSKQLQNLDALGQLTTTFKAPVTTLDPGTAVTVNLTFTDVDGTTTVVELQVTLKKPSANDIKNAIINSRALTIILPSNTNVSTANPGTISAIKAVLKSDTAGSGNYALTDDDLTKIAFNQITLSKADFTPVPTKINQDTTPASKANLNLSIKIQS